MLRKWKEQSKVSGVLRSFYNVYVTCCMYVLKLWKAYLYNLKKSMFQGITEVAMYRIFNFVYGAPEVLIVYLGLCFKIRQNQKIDIVRVSFSF